MHRPFSISSPIRITRPSHVVSRAPHDALAGAAASTLMDDGSLSTVFTLISIEDPFAAPYGLRGGSQDVGTSSNASNGGGAPRIVTAASFQQFLATMKVNIPYDVISELIVASARLSGGGAEIPDTSFSARRFGSSSLARSDEVALSEAQAYDLLATMPNTVSILLDRCELLAEMSEHPFTVAKADEMVQVKEELIAALEEDSRRMQREAEAVYQKSEALESAPTAFGTGDAASAGPAESERVERFGSPTLRTAEMEQRQRLAVLKAEARKVTDRIEELTNKLQSAVDVHALREQDAEEAEGQLKGAERRLWEHATSMLEIEEAYLAAKARFEQGKELQRELSREKERQQEVAEKAKALLKDAQDMASSIENEIVAAKNDLETHLSVEIRETQQIVANLEAATSAPSRRDRQLIALRDEYKALQQTIAETTERAQICKSELLDLKLQRQNLDRVSLKHDQWVSGSPSEPNSKAYEDTLLVSELNRAVERQLRALERQSFAAANEANESQYLAQQEQMLRLSDIQSQHRRLRSPAAIPPM